MEKTNRKSKDFFPNKSKQVFFAHRILKKQSKRWKWRKRRNKLTFKNTEANKQKGKMMNNEAAVMQKKNKDSAKRMKNEWKK